MLTTIEKLYRQERKQGATSHSALHAARIRQEWETLGGYTFSDGNEGASRKASPLPEGTRFTYRGEHAPESGHVRLRIEPDETSSFDMLAGDTFDPSCHPEIPASRIRREEESERERIYRDGVWGIIGEYWNGEEWEQADSCWGFIGDDWQHSGVDVDIMAETMSRYRALECCPTCGRLTKPA